MRCFCGNELAKIEIKGKKYNRCFQCEHLKKIDILSSIDEKKRYDFHVVDEGYYTYMTKVFEMVQPFLKGDCLDYGCGKIHCLSDILNQHQYACAYYDLYYYPTLPKAMYDTILLIEVFEHIVDSYTLLKELKLLLRPKGRVCIMTQVQPKDLEHWWYLRDETHVSFVTPKTMEVLAGITGFHVDFYKESSLFVFESIE